MDYHVTLNTQSLNNAGFTVSSGTLLLGTQMSVDLFKEMGPSSLAAAPRSRRPSHQLVEGASGTIRMASV
jgi:hypothetical protein